MSMVQERVRHGGSVHGEEKEVHRKTARSEVDRRICLIFGPVKPSTFVQDHRDIVSIAEVVVHGVGVNGEVASVIGIFPVHSDNDDAT